MENSLGLQGWYGCGIFKITVPKTNFRKYSTNYLSNSRVSAKYCPFITNHASMEILSSFQIMIHFNKKWPYDWFCGHTWGISNCCKHPHCASTKFILLNMKYSQTTTPSMHHSRTCTGTFSRNWRVVAGAFVSRYLLSDHLKNLGNTIANSFSNRQISTVCRRLKPYCTEPPNSVIFRL